MFSNIPSDLECPIAHDLLEDPITLPCCGRAVSRLSIIACLEHSCQCPMCRGDLSGFDATSVPKSINLSYLVEAFKNGGQQNTGKKEEEKKIPEWKAEIRVVPSNGVYKTVVGQLLIKNTNNKFNYKTLLIPVIDKSGSMAGGPIKQVQYSLDRLMDLTYRFPHILTNMIMYDDRASSTEVDKSAPQLYYNNIVNQLAGGGGTSFRAAFDKVVEVCNKYKSNPEVSSAVIIFLTDGEDSSIQKANRGDLVKTLKTNLENVWKDKPYTVHSVGFGANHDSDFLNSLRLIGTSEGAYRFADPSEDSDSLSNKINSLIDVIVNTSSIPLKLIETDESAPIISQCGSDKMKYWVNLTNLVLGKPYCYSIEVNGELVNISTCTVDSLSPIEEDKLKDEWMSSLIDEIASEMLVLSSNIVEALDKQIHCELLLQRSRSILVRLDSSTPNAIRLGKLITLIDTMKVGGTVNQLKLTDMKFEGNFATKSSGDPNKQGSVYRPSNYDPNAPVQPLRIAPIDSWKIIQAKNRRLYYADKNLKQTFLIITQHKNNKVFDWINSITTLDEVDDNGSNALIVASSIGRCAVVKKLLESGLVDINGKNNDGYTALDVAALYGYWNTFDILLEQGVKTNIDGSLLLRTCISNKYFNTCRKLVKNKISIITDDMMDCVPSNEGLAWLSANSQKSISYEQAILKGMYDVVEDQLDTILTKISWKPFMDIFSKPSTDHVRIVDLLLKNNKADPDEIVDTIRDGENEITWPLFNACEKGDMSMFKVLMNYVAKDTLNMQNNKGTTVLWIACCNKHIDIVSDLLSNGADPNVCNFKGDGPLIPSCQKGSSTLVELLLDSGARMDSYNKNRDNPILICCRTGQADILEILFNRLNKNEQTIMLNSAAEIDGFIPLLAATELDKTSCIKVCHKYGADLEARTANDNKIIAGATALHLACFYGRLSSVRTLYELGANVASQTTVHGYTPLHVAIKQGHIEVVRYLLVLEQGRQCLKVSDYEGRLPAYYAHITGNESILEEFFVNKLAILLEKSLYTDNETEKRCGDTLVKYGKSLGCFEYNDITNIDIGRGATLLSHALLNNNLELISCLKTMGAEMNNPDNYGITPSFWAHLLGQDLGTPVDPKTIEMVDRVKNIAKKNIQNKLLLNLPQKIPLLLDDKQNIINPMIKMNDGYALTVHKSVLDTLKQSSLIEQSLLGFMEKLKNNKNFPDGKECLEYVLWDAKVHLTKVTASGEDVLQPIHILALYLYTSNLTLFQQVNKSLTNWTNSSVWHPYINCLYQAIKLLPKYTDEVYRAVNTKFDMDDYKIGNVIKWSTFSICSKEFASTSELLNKKKGIIFIIKSQTGRLISKYSKSPVDSEVIFLPDSQFEITNHYVASLICLGQENIRTSTFAVKEKDLQKATNGESCIIVELKEIVETKSSNSHHLYEDLNKVTIKVKPSMVSNNEHCAITINEQLN